MAPDTAAMPVGVEVFPSPGDAPCNDAEGLFTFTPPLSELIPISATAAMRVVAEESKDSDIFAFRYADAIPLKSQARFEEAAAVATSSNDSDAPPIVAMDLARLSTSPEDSVVQPSRAAT